ncbi:PLP-dependent aminotransferase family protein [Paracoccus yeei]|uniref:PLP-dependent aminotransferase family protein n=1 Tax=Paracoccus yeei TaxID=147645 RepID=A0A1V0GU28_9RHOB|nr:PLP-dependent aminotransferase family protein [Paracoccus yeei]ARC37366.1 PLP-dependent aminotransferase family protein [Paracoccus yeei]
MADTLPVETIFLRDDALTLQGRLAAAIVRAVLETRSRPGVRLPSSRKLARALGISRMTVTLVYQNLVSQGYLETLPRSGIAIAATVPLRRVEVAARGVSRALDWADWLSDQTLPKRVIRKPENWREFRYPFIFGQADPRLFDHGAWRDCARRALGTRDFSDLAADRYGADDPLLVDYICSHTLPRRGFQASPDEVLITLGAQNALFLTTELLARIDRLAVAEEPGYPDFAETLRRARSPTAFLPVDGMGLDPAMLPEATQLIIVTPSHHIPTGATMPPARRHALLQRAEQLNALIIEDDYDFEMSYLAPPVPALKSLDSAGRVIYIGSFSKSLFPGLRIGYMVGPAPLIARARALRSIMLRHPPTHLQRITSYFLALGHYDAHIVRLRQALKQRRKVLEQALAQTTLQTLGAAAQGGSSIWLGAPGTDSADLAARLHAESVLIEPGAVFFEQAPAPCPLFRLGYGSIADDLIPEGVARIDRMARAMAQQAAKPAA